MKEFIYLDLVEINSILGQLNDGIPSVTHQTNEALKAVTETNTQSKIKKTSGGVSTPIRGEHSRQKGIGETFSELKQTLNQTAIDTVYGDYAVNVIEKQLDNQGKLETNITTTPIGEIVKATSSYSEYNFKLLHDTLANEGLKFLIKHQNDSNDSDGASKREISEEMNNMRWLEKITDAYSLVNKDSELIKLSNAIAIAETKNFRMNDAQRQMLLARNSKLTILGIIESEVSEETLDLDSFGTVFSQDPSKIGDFIPNIAFLFMSILGILHAGDRFIKPIALYFE
ncbi:hypothetical protein ABB39_01245 [Levilactobacillus brevis]|uniref:DUF6414 family protein n=1 Tax=Levilactobacillus brevis TaxID=1580 RepID=UPI0007603840|nr:hypothetical protein [Levilactobacillus brevis]KWT52439.1 hypothetical protein ABB39_01245 [Levilactobacillus brevis]